MIETERGYYISYFGYLYYADKTSLTNWVPVCNNPNCAHQRAENCPARTLGGIWEKNGALYTFLNSTTMQTPNLILTSVGDGSGWTCAFSDETSPFNTAGAVSFTPQFYQNGLCINVSKMDTDGFWDNSLYFVEDSGAYTYTYAENFPDCATCSAGNTTNAARGDLTMYMITEYPENGEAGVFENQELYRVSPESAEKLEFPEGCSYYGAYLSGDTMVHYHPNDGFYQLTLSTGKETKISDAAYQDAFGFCLDGKFLIETTVNYKSTAETTAFRYFDGTDWTEIALPEGMGARDGFWIIALTSDALFLSRKGADHASILSILKLGESTLVDCMKLIPNNPLYVQKQPGTVPGRLCCRKLQRKLSF